MSTVYEKYIHTGTCVGIPCKNIYTMITILLFLAILLSWWFIFKSIDWFEKI